MSSTIEPSVAVVIPVGPGKEAVLDTIDSIEVFCPERHNIVLIDDKTEDGTYDALLSAKRSNWELIRNKERRGWRRIVHTLCFGFEQAIERTECSLILKLDVDALIIKPGLLSEALNFAKSNRKVGMFGVYEVDHNRPRSFESHRKLFDRETAWYRRLVGLRAPWREFLAMAERKGYKRGENVFGGAYFLTRECAMAMKNVGAFGIPGHWPSEIAEDVYFSMMTVATGFNLGHFAAPEGPLCMDWCGLPFPARTFHASRFKLVHSVDKGPNTGRTENDGKTAREVFRELRKDWHAVAGTRNHATLGAA